MSTEIKEESDTTTPPPQEQAQPPRSDDIDEDAIAPAEELVQEIRPALSLSRVVLAGNKILIPMSEGMSAWLDEFVRSGAASGSERPDQLPTLRFVRKEESDTTTAPQEQAQPPRSDDVDEDAEEPVQEIRPALSLSRVVLVGNEVLIPISERMSAWLDEFRRSDAASGSETSGRGSDQLPTLRPVRQWGRWRGAAPAHPALEHPAPEHPVPEHSAPEGERRRVEKRPAPKKESRSAKRRRRAD